MISLSSWMKSMGVRGQLAPFFKSVCVYFVALGVAGEAARAPSPAAVACKCAPVLCLLAAVLYRLTSLPVGKRRYAACVSAGLALSALGDALLVWPARLVGGMAAFAGAHGAYIAAFGWRPLRAGAGAGAYAAAAAFLALVPAPGALRLLVPPYALLLATMAWRGAARGPPAAAGAALFLVSDAILGYGLFVGPVPFGQVLVMSTYYMAQLGIAYSALQEPPQDGGGGGGAASQLPHLPFQKLVATSEVPVLPSTGDDDIRRAGNTKASLQ